MASTCLTHTKGPPAITFLSCGMRRDYSGALDALNRLQTNWSVIDQIRKDGKPLRDESLVPEMLEWTRRVGYTPSDFNRLNILHVTGTKGKGSTCAFTQSSLLKASDYQLKVGLFTSPHLTTVRERIQINGEPIAPKKFADYFFEVYDRLSESESDIKKFPRMGPGVKPSYFRFLTLVSLHAFLKEGVDAAVYEVGIGGEYDSTNIFERPVATAVTSLGIDHTNVLGDTIEEIAWNKAGIFRKNVPAFTISDQPKEGMAVLKARAEEKGTELTVLDIPSEISSLELGLAGEFQRKNATIAANLAATRLGIQPSDPRILDGLRNAAWPGRCEVLETSKATWYIDGAHTSESLTVAAEWLVSKVDKTKPLSLVFNQQKRDNVEALLSGLYQDLQQRGLKIQEAYFSTNKSFAAGFQPDMISHNVSKDQVENLTIQKRLARQWKSLDPTSNVHVCSSLEEAVSQINGQVFVTGSLLMVGGLLAVLKPQQI